MSSTECKVGDERPNQEESNSVPFRVQESDSSNSSKDISQAYGKLQHATERAIKRMTSKTKILPYIKEHFKRVYKTDGKYVLEVYKSMMDQLEMMIKDEQRLQLEDSNVQQLLAELDKTAQEHPATERNWRPSGKPEKDVKAHLQKSTSEEVQQLEKILSSLEYQNKRLNDHVAKMDQKLEQSIKTVQSHHRSWEKAASMMTDETRQALIDCDIKLNRGTS